MENSQRISRVDFMARIPYTKYIFNPPSEPLSFEQYEALRHLSDAEFKKQLRQVKKTAGRDGMKEFWSSWKFCLIVLVVCVVLASILDLINRAWKAWGIFEGIFTICMLIMVLTFFGTLYSSLLSLSSSSQFVAEVAKLLKRQRSTALKATSYREFLSAFPDR